MVKAGTVTGREITTNKDGTNPRLMLQVRMTNDADIQTIELYCPAGQDSNPPNGSRVIILELSSAYKIALAADDNIAPDGVSGDHEIYSESGGVKGARVKLHSADSKVSISNDNQSLLTLIEGLIDEVKAIVTVGSPTQHVLNPATKTALENYKIEFRGLLRNVT